MWDEYERKARVYPALLVSAPLFVLHFLYLRVEFTEWNSLIGALKSIKSVGMASLPFVALYLIVNTSRFFGKAIFEQWYFKDSLHLPTTSFLLYSTNHLSATYKASIREKIGRDFSLALSSQTEESNDTTEARRQISEVVNLIRDKVRGDNFVFKYNIQYGFWRNLIGGSVVALLLSIVDWVVFKYIDPQPFVWVLSVVMTICYAAMLLSSWFVINYLGKQYAHRLYTQYMSR